MKKNNILREISHYKKQAILGPLFKLLEASFELFVPLVVSDIIDNGIGSGDFRYIVLRFALLFGLALIGLVCSISAQYFSAKSAVGFASRVRQKLFDKISNFDFTNFDKFGTSTLVNRMTSDINIVQNGVNLVLRLFLRSPFVVFGAMIMAFRIDVKIAYLFVLAIILLSIVVFGIMLITIPLYKKTQGKSDKVLSLTRENLIGTRVIRAFSKEEEEISNYKKETDSLTKSQKFVGNISALMNPLTYVIINAIVVWLIDLGAIEVNLGYLTQGSVVALYNYMSQILVELIKLANLIIEITKAFASKNRIESILNTENTLHTVYSDLTSHHYIEFRNVSMAYPLSRENSLTDINFTLEKGQTLGIIGGTGSGKSTLVNLLLHFYDVSDGHIFIDGLDITSIDNKLLRDKIGIVMQKSAVFKGTVAENLLFGNPNATKEDMLEALKISQCLDFVMDKEGGLDYKLEQNGRNLSGGQKQRISIARAIIKKPEILILDDSSSALDYKTDMLLRKAIREITPKLTTIIVSQRTSSISFADKIIVLDDGKAVGIGTHEELLSTCAVYKEIYDSQYKRGN